MDTMKELCMLLTAYAMLFFALLTVVLGLGVVYSYVSQIVLNIWRVL